MLCRLPNLPFGSVGLLDSGGISVHIVISFAAPLAIGWCNRNSEPQIVFFRLCSHLVVLDGFDLVVLVSSLPIAAVLLSFALISGCCSF